MSLYVNFGFVELLESLIVDNIRDLVNVMGVGGFLIFATLFVIYRSYVSYQNFQMKKLESKANIDLINAQTTAQLKIAEQQADTDTSSRRDKMLELAITNGVTVNQLLLKSIETASVTNEILRSVQAQSATNSNALSTYLDSTEAYQARMSIAALQIQEHSQISRSIIETLPEKLDGGFERAMERLNAIGLTLDTQHSAIKADIAQVVIEIAKVAQSKPEPGIGVEAGESKEPTAPAQDSGVVS